MERAAAIDLGTQTALLLVVERGARGELVVLADECAPVRLGQGLSTRAELDPAAVERALRALAGFNARADELRVPDARRRAVATAVLRRARDAATFVLAARERAGVALEVLSEADEARLGHLAVVGDGAEAGVLVIDVGGGSTELCADAGRARASVPLGALVAAEALPDGGARPCADEPAWRALKVELRSAFARVPRELRACAAGVVCLGGTAGNLACLDQRLARHDPTRAEGHRFAAPAALRQAERLAGLDLASRRALAIEPERAATLPAGLLCLHAALERVGAGEARASGRGLRYGLARELLGPG